MPRYTKVYCDFSYRVGEVTLLRKKAAALERSKHSLRHGAEISALCRASVVLLSSHIEAYIKELGELALDSTHVQKTTRDKISSQFFYYVSREKIDAIRNSTQPDSIAASVQSFIDNDVLFWQGNGAVHGPLSSTSFNTGFSNPKFEKVKSYISRFGYTDFRRDFMRKMNREANQLIITLDLIVDTRNSIAHGDPTATKTPNEVKEMEAKAKEFCRVVDDIFSRWCRENLCTIR